METCVGPHTYVIFTLLFISAAYGVRTIEPDSICAHVIALAFVFAGLYFAAKLIPRGRVNPDGKAVFITGCDTGFGHKLALQCDQLGLRVFASCLHPDGDNARELSSKSSKRLTIVGCDVTSDEQVTTARDAVSEAVIRENLVLWACVNNAGLTRMGEVEMLPVTDFQYVMDVNLFGTVRVTKAFIPLVRQSKGRFVNVTSVLSRVAVPCRAPYCMSKFAGETFSDVLRYEMHKWGVKVAIIQPGPYAGTTNCTSGVDWSDLVWNGMDEPTRQLYGRPYVNKFQEAVVQDHKEGSYRDNTPVIDAMVDAILSKRPKHRYTIGGLVAPFMWLEFARYNLLPSWLSDMRMLQEQKAMGIPTALQGKDKRN